MTERARDVWERAFPLMVMLCYNHLKVEADLLKQLQQNVHGLDLGLAGVGDMPAETAKEATRVGMMLQARHTPCLVPTSCLTSHMEKKYSRKADILTKRALGKDTVFSLDLPVFREQWEALFAALPLMHWEKDAIITARLIWALLPPQAPGRAALGAADGQQRLDQDGENEADERGLRLVLRHPRAARSGGPEWGQLPPAPQHGV